MPHRYFTEDINDKSGTLHGEEAHHLMRVMRAKLGEELTVCNKKGTDYSCVITAFAQDTVALAVNSFAPCVSEASVMVTLYIGYPKQDKLEWVIQKAVELGAVRIVPFFSKYCVVTPKKEEDKNIRYNRIALEAAKQSGRGIIPAVAMPLSFKDMVKEAAQNDAALFCYEAGGASIHSRLHGAKTVCVITGSEGGFSKDEAAEAMAAGCTAISLGTRILRCETAPIAALASVMTLTGDLQ
ncbi:MAG: RsmE family RNA methyltransferase [Oscillospiraceae bacterium]